MKNRVLGLVREYQYNTYEKRYSGIDLYSYPHHDKIAEAYDMDYFHCDSNDELGDVIDRFLSSDKASLLVCDIETENKVK